MRASDSVLRFLSSVVDMGGSQIFGPDENRNVCWYRVGSLMLQSQEARRNPFLDAGAFSSRFAGVHLIPWVSGQLCGILGEALV